jgi:hypothetical protein
MGSYLILAVFISGTTLLGERTFNTIANSRLLLGRLWVFFL